MHHCLYVPYISQLLYIIEQTGNSIKHQTCFWRKMKLTVNYAKTFAAQRGKLSFFLFQSSVMLLLNIFHP